MACLVNFNSSQLLGCGPAPAPGLGRPVSAKVINASQINSYTVTGGVATITRAPGTPEAASLECANGATTVTLGLKGGEVAPQLPDVTISTYMFATTLRSNFSGPAAISTNGGNSRVVIAVDHGNGIIRVYGLGYPLECLSIEGDTNGNGFVLTTFGVEDWQPGTTIYAMTAADYAELSTAIPAGGGGKTPPSGGDPILDENPLG